MTSKTSTPLDLLWMAGLERRRRCAVNGVVCYSCVCVYIYMYIYIYVYNYIYIYVCECVGVCVCIYIYICVCVCACVGRPLSLYVIVHLCLCVCVYWSGLCVLRVFDWQAGCVLEYTGLQLAGVIM